MKVSAISPHNKAIYNLNNKKLSNSMQKAGYKISNYANNSVSETAGRMQVQFLGSYTEGRTGLTYRDKDSHIVYGADGSLNFTTLEYGKKINIHETLDKKIKEIAYPNGDSLYFELDKKTENSLEVVYEKEMNRKIITTVEDGKQEIKVLDLNTNLYVTEGERAWRVEDYRNIKMRTTRNIITGIVVKQESYNSREPFTMEYDEKTGNLTRKAFYDKNEDMYKELIYDSDGNVVDEKSTSRDKAYRIFIKRDGNSGKEISHIELYYDNKGILRQETKLYPDTNAIKEETTYTDIEERRDLYNQNPNLRTKSLIFDKDSKYLRQEIFYFKNSENIDKIILHLDNGSKIISRFDEGTNLPFIIDEYAPDNFLTKSTRNWAGSIKKESVIENNRDRKEIIETQYDESGKYCRTRTVMDMYSKAKKEYVEFYPASDKMKIQCVYYEKYHVVNTFDLQGNRIKSERIPNKTREFKLYSYEDIFGIDEKQEEVELTREIIEKISRVTGSEDAKYSDVPYEEWCAFAKFLGLKGYRELINMDQKTYRMLVNKFHPDKYSGDSERKLKVAEDIVKIINNIHDNNKK